MVDMATFVLFVVVNIVTCCASSVATVIAIKKDVSWLKEFRTEISYRVSKLEARTRELEIKRD